jgi:hypothetical protein
LRRSCTRCDPTQRSHLPPTPRPTPAHHAGRRARLVGAARECSGGRTHLGRHGGPNRHLSEQGVDDDTQPRFGSAYVCIIAVWCRLPAAAVHALLLHRACCPSHLHGPGVKLFVHAEAGVSGSIHEAASEEDGEHAARGAGSAWRHGGAAAA